MLRSWEILMFALVVAMVCVSGRGDSDTTGFSVEEKWSRSFAKFESFREEFGRKYASAAETLERFRVFARNLQRIEELNAMEKGTAVYGVNEMADWTEEEFRARRANLDLTKILGGLNNVEEEIYTINDDNKTAPDSKDWREEGKVSPVKDQGECGSCWAFATAACVESMYAIQNNSMAGNYSEQQLVDCDPESQGCNGGWMNDTIDYLIGAGGIVSEDSYPYTGKDGKCQFSNDSVIAAPVTKKIRLPSRDEKAMKKFVGLVGPTTAAINADWLQFYRKGVFNFFLCPSSAMSLNHAMLVVGYGRDRRAGDYWILKNSWGPSWGEDGFLRIKRGRNRCGLSIEVVSLSTAPQEEQ